MRKRTWRKIQERIGVGLFIIVAIAVMVYVALLLVDLFVVDAPKSHF
jgi:hypothetical protein